MKEYKKFLKANSELATSQKSIYFLTSELNDYKQRYESSEKRYKQLVQSSCEALEKKSKDTVEKILRAGEKYADEFKGHFDIGFGMFLAWIQTKFGLESGVKE